MGWFHWCNQIEVGLPYVVDITSGLLPDPLPRIYAQVFSEADKDGDGNLTYTEFERVMYFYPEFYK